MESAAAAAARRRASSLESGEISSCLNDGARSQEENRKKALPTTMAVHTTACPRNCYSTCAFEVEVEGGRLRRIVPHAGNLATAEGPCLKGLSYWRLGRSRRHPQAVRGPVDAGAHPLEDLEETVVALFRRGARSRAPDRWCDRGGGSARFPGAAMRSLSARFQTPRSDADCRRPGVLGVVYPGRRRVLYSCPRRPRGPAVGRPRRPPAAAGGAILPRNHPVTAFRTTAPVCTVDGYNPPGARLVPRFRSFSAAAAGPVSVSALFTGLASGPRFRSTHSLQTRSEAAPAR